jgi:hypothetical protein
MYQPGANTASAGLRVHDKLRHAECILLRRGEIQITDDCLAAASWARTSNQEMLSPALPKLPQNLLTYRCHSIKFACCRGEFTYLLLLLRGEYRPPLGWSHWLCNGSARGP